MVLAYDARHLSNNKNYEVQRANHFEVIIPGLGDDFTLSVTRCALPEVTIAPVELNYGNTKVKVAGLVEVGDGSMDCRDFILPDIEKKLYDWQNEVYNQETGKLGWAADYKRDIKINQYAPDGTYIRGWVAWGAWVTTLTPGEGDVTNGEAKSISLTISYDGAKVVR